MGEDLVNLCRILDAGDGFDGGAALTAGLDVDVEYAPSSKDIQFSCFGKSQISLVLKGLS